MPRPSASPNSRAEPAHRLSVEGSFVLPSGDRFRKADDAGYAVIDKRCKGMQFWHIETSDGSRIALADLRWIMLTT